MALPDSAFRRWTHSFEDDAGDVVVFRPVEHDFPPARGRAGIEFRPAGEFVDWPIGADDRSRAIDGHWEESPDGTVRVSTGAARTYEIVECTDEVLRVRVR